ncbi:MAG: Uncharacterized protein G01um101416_277 [Microgenomates group bacterium Gr01-1014_16]|nr:MAG: Uncharacterized protein G01um101416_277 [Microgenomates group bacterium Gr01-1014_16]
MPDVYQAPDAVKPVDPTSHEATLGASRFDPKVFVAQILEKSGEKQGREMMGAYCVNPGKRFINEQDDEEVVLLLRAHPITNLKWILVMMGLVVLPELLTAVGVFSTVPVRFVVMGKLMWYLGVLAYGLERFLNWYYSVFFVTNERVVDIDFINLLTRVVSYANLNHIEEPSMVAGGFFRSLFKYGDVFVATAASDGTAEARAVPYPDRVVRIISELSEELEKRRERGE